MTLPSCVAPNVLSVAELLFCNVNIVEELQNLRFICNCCSTLLDEMKTLATYQIAKAEIYEQLFSNGTSW